MKTVKAVIFDVYHTLLAVEAGPPDAEKRWQDLWTAALAQTAPVTLREFDRACRTVVAEDHRAGRAAGVDFPEVDWRSVATRAAGDLSALHAAALDAFLLGHAGLQRTARAMPGAKAFLQDLRERGILAGIASNAQHYTLGELTAAGISVGDFREDLCFWSFERGFSKPDPAGFAWLTERLSARGILPVETLMIGDREDNDILPARKAGWQTWHFTGTWPEL